MHLKICSFDAAWKPAPHDIGLIVFAYHMARHLLSTRRQPPRKIDWTMPKMHQVSLASLFTLWFYIILLVIWWGKKLRILFFFCPTITESDPFFWALLKQEKNFFFLFKYSRADTLWKYISIGKKQRRFQ